jgi:hypothetical protein
LELPLKGVEECGTPAEIEQSAAPNTVADGLVALLNAMLEAIKVRSGLETPTVGHQRVLKLSM